MRPPTRSLRALTKDAEDPRPPQMRAYSGRVHARKGNFHAPLAPIDRIGIYVRPSQMMLPVNEVRDGDDVPLYGIQRDRTSSQNIKPPSQFDRALFNRRGAEGRYGANLKLALQK